MYLGRRPDVGLSSGCYLSPPRCNSVAVAPISRLAVCLGFLLVVFLSFFLSFFLSLSRSVSLPFSFLLSMPRSAILRQLAPTPSETLLLLLCFVSLARSRSFHDLPVIFLRRISSAGRPDNSGGSALKESGRFTDTSAAGDISLLNYCE